MWKSIRQVWQFFVLQSYFIYLFIWVLVLKWPCWLFWVKDLMLTLQFYILNLSLECYYISKYMLLYSIIKYRAENICSYLALYVQGSHQDTITSVYVSRYALCSSLSVCVLLYLTCRLFIYLFIFWVLHRNTFFIFWGEEFGVLVGAVFFSFLIINIWLFFH